MIFSSYIQLLGCRWRTGGKLAFWWRQIAGWGTAQGKRSKQVKGLSRGSISKLDWKISEGPKKMMEIWDQKTAGHEVQYYYIGAIEQESWKDGRWWSEGEMFGVKNFEGRAVTGCSKDVGRTEYLLEWMKRHCRWDRQGMWGLGLGWSCTGD